MSEEPDPLETELSALTPRAISPELRQRIGDRLDARPSRHRRMWGIALVGVLIAASVLALVAPWRSDPVAPEPPVIAPPLPSPAAVETDESTPTLVAYQRALARSPEELDALLDRSAPMPVEAFARNNVTIDSLLGDN